jgi:hypothetical protein
MMLAVALEVVFAVSGTTAIAVYEVIREAPFNRHQTMWTCPFAHLLLVAASPRTWDSDKTPLDRLLLFVYVDAPLAISSKALASQELVMFDEINDDLLAIFELAYARGIQPHGN